MNQTVECSCCGESRERVVGVGAREDVQLCPGCIEWLFGRSGATSTPTLPVADIGQGQAFFAQAGFEIRVYEGGGFAFVELDGRSVFDLDEIRDLDVAANHAGCYIITDKVDEWHARLGAAGLPVTDVKDETWGMREFTLTDPFRNSIRIGHTLGD